MTSLEAEPTADKVRTATLDVVETSVSAAIQATRRFRERLYVLSDRRTGLFSLAFPPHGADDGALPDEHEFLGCLPPIYPEWLGERGFAEAHGCRFPYIVGEMARGIATPQMVIAAARAGLMTFYGTAGLSLQRIENGLREIRSGLDADCTSWGANLIHMPTEPHVEDQTVALFLARDVRRVSASAFTALTPAAVRYACAGLRTGPGGSAVRRNHLFAKISRPEVALLFLSPAPEPILRDLVAREQLTHEEAELARRVPLATDVTVEADSGGHTDNRPLTVLLPATLALRDRIGVERGYDRAVRVGAAGGLGTPSAVASAFATGAAYVLTGSINQSAQESGLSLLGRRMLAEAGVADVAMAPAADMFEMGVKVQVLKRGTLFAQRAQKLYTLFCSYASLDELPQKDREQLEQDIFRASIPDIWDATLRYFLERDPQQAARAQNDARHRMALVFRWYLAHGSRWAAEGVEPRRVDFQIWCGPSMGAFNEWVRGSFLEPIEQRTVAQIARNLLEGAAVVTRAHQLRSYGVPVPDAAFAYQPRPLR